MSPLRLGKGVILVYMAYGKGKAIILVYMTYGPYIRMTPFLPWREIGMSPIVFVFVSTIVFGASRRRQRRLDGGGSHHVVRVDILAFDQILESLCSVFGEVLQLRFGDKESEINLADLAIT